MASTNQLMGGTNTAPNRAPAAKVLAGAIANERVAQALISALGPYTLNAVVATGSSTATNLFPNSQVGDFIIHIPATAGNSSFNTVVTAGNAVFTPVSGDLYLDLSLVNLDSNNPIPYSTLNGNKTGNGGQEF